MTFLTRAQALPMLGIGVSTEYGAGASRGALDVHALRAARPDVAGFLELGVEVDKGLDDDARRWVAAGLPTTYHFLDVNLDEPEDLDDAWLDAVRALIAATRPAWLCGDAGLWHHGPRERGHMLLLPPVLTAEAADAMAVGIARLRAETGLEVLPENPPGQLFVGDLHLLDFYARLADRADTGLLLDAAHLGIYQQMTGHSPLTGLDGFPCDRVVEIHVAGGTPRDHDGLAWVEDDHTTDVTDATWAILEHVVPRAPNLKAVVFECERNPLDRVVPAMDGLAARLRAAGWAGVAA
ncbi:MAG: DUF692 family protein [Myxococcales bacterium]|nr:DUF692 family protein [Myxococcales bacterium]MCB9733897.1 DUF692 family protein [Deltaproteobacteria bacterium]